MGIKLPIGRQPGDVPPDDKRCVRHIPSKNGERCRNYRVKGATECRNHNIGFTKQDALQRKQAAFAAKSRAIQKYEKQGPLEISGAEDVIDLLEERMGVQLQMARAVDDIVAKLTVAGEMRYEHRAGEQLRGEVQVWLQLNQQLTKLGADYLKIGLDERKVQIAEAQAKILVGVIRAVLDRLDLTGEQRRVAARAVPEELERVSRVIEGRVIRLWPVRLILASCTATGLSSATRKPSVPCAGRCSTDGLQEGSALLRQKGRPVGLRPVRSRLSLKRAYLTVLLWPAFHPLRESRP